MKSTSGMFLSPAGDAGGGTKLAKTMLVDTQISKLTRDVEKLMGIAAQHGAKIKELMVTAANSVSQVEFMSAITTTRFQNLNIVKSIHKPEEKEADENSVSSAPVTNAKRGTVVNDDKDGTDVKQLKALVSHLENELHQFDFKNGMENKKIENEMKISRKEFYELKNHITSLEKKLEDFAHAVEKGGISTNVQFVDPNQKAPPPPRKSSFLGDFSVTEINQQHQQNLATKAQQLCIEEEASEITWKDDNGSNAEEGDSDISFEETATMNDQENIIETSKHNEPEKRRQSIAKAKEIVHEEPETVLQPVVEHVVRHPTQVHTQHQVPSVIQAKQEAVIQSQPLDSTTKPVQHETRRQSVMKETTAHNNHQTTSIPANPDPQTISPIKETQPTISIPAETKQINITHEPNLVSVTSRVERRKSTVPVANQPEVEITIPANSTSRRMSVQKSKPNRQTIASKKKEVELVFDDDLPDKEDEFFQVENRRLVQAAFHSQSSPLKREDIFNDYREQSRLLFTKIVAIKQVEDLSRVVTNESVTNALNAAENKLFGKFQEEIFDRLGRSSTVSIGAQTLESGPTHTQKMQAINNVAAVMNNGGSNSSGTNVARTTQRVSRINRSNTINHNKNVPADKDLPELANTNQISKQKRNSVAEKSPTKESESLHNFNLSNIGEDEDIHPAAILETDSTDNAEADVTGNHRPQTTAKTSRKLPSAGNTRTKNGQIVIPDVIMRDSLPSEAEDSVFESLSNLDPLFIQDLSASFSVDLAPAPMGDVRKWVDKKFTKLVELMNERFQAIDDHNKHISDNCNRLLQETNRLHQEMFLLSKNMEKLNESNKILSKRVKETMENISDNLDPLTAATTQSQENIVEMEKMLVTVVEDLDKFKKDQGKQHNEITKELSALRPKANTMKDNMDLTRFSHVVTNASEFELETMKKELKHYASLYDVLYGKYEHAVGQLAKYADAKQVQLLPKSARDKVTAHLRATSSPKSNRIAETIAPSSPPSGGALARKEMEEMLQKHSSELKHEMGLMRGAVQACLQFIELQSVERDDVVKTNTMQLPPSQPPLPLKSPMRNRKLISQPVDVNKKRVIASDAVPSLMNGKYLSRPNVEFKSLEEIELKLRAETHSREYMGPQQSPNPPTVHHPTSSSNKRNITNNTFAYPSELDSPHTVSTLTVPQVEFGGAAIGEDPTPKINPMGKEYQSIWYNDFGGAYNPNHSPTALAENLLMTDDLPHEAQHQ